MKQAIIHFNGSNGAEVPRETGAFRPRHRAMVGLGLWMALGVLAVEWAGLWRVVDRGVRSASLDAVAWDGAWMWGAHGAGVDETLDGSLVPGRFGQALNAARGGFLAPGDVRFGQPPVTLGLWSFEESKEEYLARWTPGGETHQRGLPYPHRVAEYEFESDEDWVDDRWQETRWGPFVTHSTQIPGYEVGVKTAVVFLGEDEMGTVLFDLERCAPTAGLVEAKFKTDPARFGLLRKPQLEGRMQFHLPPAKAWRLGGATAAGGLGRPLDRGEVRYRGLYLKGERVLFRFEILGGTVLDSSWVESRGRVTAIRRSIETSGVGGDVAMTLTEMPVEPEWWEEDGLRVAWCDIDGKRMAVALPGKGAAGLAAQGRDVLIELSAATPASVTWLCWTGPGSDWAAFLDLARRVEAGQRLERLQEPGGRRWGEPLITRGQVGDGAGAPYVIDTITVPHENPHRALFFIGALDFFPNGDAAVCTAHGDVWVVRGLNDELERVTWQRFATGLYQPLGLRVVEGRVIVLGRDQLTRLHDRNGDGEADFYETFNQDLEIQGHDHAYATRLEIDSRGDLYFLKSGGGPHGSAVLKVSRDGSRLDVVARGFRHAPSLLGTLHAAGRPSRACRQGLAGRHGAVSGADFSVRPWRRAFSSRGRAVVCGGIDGLADGSRDRRKFPTRALHGAGSVDAGGVSRA